MPQPANQYGMATWPDVEAIAKSGLIRADWQDLDRDDISIITPNPKTSGNGKYSFLAAWGAALAAGGSEEDA
jgi:ABC-type sulfate transport system substrate-binding protein